EVLNMANGENTTVLQIVNTLNKILGKNIQPKFLPVRAGDVFKTHADITKIKAKLNFKPLINFEEGMRKTVAYFKQKWAA
ncbi:MAG: LPS biosynthesis protein WbpP, partial [Candidatus Omnitrophica bacterium]|nr:LPS biosynthesis protein WbpP [Candidatus Omnitrophota bacterium]